MQVNDELLDIVEQQKKVVNIIREVAAKVNTNLHLDAIFQSTFKLLDEYFGYKHMMILLVDESDPNKLILKSNYGYANEGLGAIVQVGQGVVGIVAKNKRLLRMANVQLNLRMAKSLRLEDNLIKLPGIENCVSQLAVPLLVHKELVGVINIEAHKAGLFQKSDEDLLKMIGVQIGIAINNAKQFDIIERTNNQLKELNETLEVKVLERTQELNNQKEIVEEKNKEIYDSIKYAKRIQHSMLPSVEILQSNFSDYFVFYRPKDIVSGDFYWFNRQGNRVYYVCADCTGHGVPGAFVSMIGSVGLRSAIVEMKLNNPADILDNLNEFIEKTINTGGNIKDGMDLTLCCIDFDSNILSFAGANNGIIVVRDQQIIEIRGDKQPVGSFDYRKPFNKTDFDLKSGDRIYSTSDGYIDQFGGPKDKKFMKKRYKKLILENQNLSMKEQENVFKTSMDSWIGNGEQIDDICVFGVEFKSTK